MKFLILLLVSLTASASNWMPLSKIQSQSLQAYQLEEDCTKLGEQCLDVGDEPEIVKEGFTSLQDNYSKSEVESCLDEADCQSKHEAKICTDSGETSIKNLELLEVYCSKFLSKSLVKDNSGWSGFKAGKATEAQLEAGISLATNLRKCGERVMALMLVRNQPKGLTTTQVKQLVSAYASIKGLLESGSLASAKEEIQAVTADGVLVTNADKTALSAEIDKCLGM